VCRRSLLSMTCPDCKGSGKVTLLTSQVDCNCVGDATNVDPNQYTTTITIPDNLGTIEECTSPSGEKSYTFIALGENHTIKREIITEAELRGWIQEFLDENEPGGSEGSAEDIEDIDLDDYDITITMPDDLGGLPDEASQNTTWYFSVDPAITIDVPRKDLEMDAFGHNREYRTSPEEVKEQSINPSGTSKLGIFPSDCVESEARKAAMEEDIALYKKAFPNLHEGDAGWNRW
jgi:hypothetical protein